MTPATLDEAVRWLQDHQDDRDIPAKLHFIETENQGELGSPRFTPSFLRYLYARSNDVNPEAEENITCSDVSWNCPVCAGDGFYVVMRERYRYPLWRAMYRLKDRSPKRPGHPSPITCVAALFAARFDWLTATKLLRLNVDLGEALLLMAVRSLYGLYELGPVPRPPKWTELSESQQRAVVGGDAA